MTHRIERSRQKALAAMAFGFVALFVVAVQAAPPVLLVYGFQPIPGFRTTELWDELSEQLAGRPIADAQSLEIEAEHSLVYLRAADAAHRDVFLSDYALPYEPTVRDLRFYAERLAHEIEWITYSQSVSSIDLVAHSMGALVARAYIEADDFDDVIGSEDFPDHGTTYRGDVGTLISLAGPHHGAFLASFGQWLSRLGRQLSPEGEFLALLNRDHMVDGRLTSLRASVRYVSMAGQTCFGCGFRLDQTACLRECVDAGLAWQGSDLIVLMASAYLPEAENVACIGMDHVDMHTHPVLAETIERILNGASAPSAIYADTELQAGADEAL